MLCHIQWFGEPAIYLPLANLSKIWAARYTTDQAANLRQVSRAADDYGRDVARIENESNLQLINDLD
jgi:hypothetical protein